MDNNLSEIDREQIYQLRQKGEEDGRSEAARKFNKFCSTNRSDLEKVRWLVTELDGIYDMLEIFTLSIGIKHEERDADGKGVIINKTGVACYEPDAGEKTAHPKYKDSYWYDHEFYRGLHFYWREEYNDAYKAALATGITKKELPIPMYLGGRENHIINTLELGELPKEETMVTFTNTNGSSQNIKLIWNGNSNTLADLFYQLKFELFTKDKKPFLDSSIEDIAAFLKNNFDCFSNTKINTIKDKLNQGKSEERPQKSENKLSIIKGSIPS